MPTYSVYVSASDAEKVEKHRNVGETTTQAFGRIIKEKAEQYSKTITIDGTPIVPQYERQ